MTVGLSEKLERLIRHFRHILYLVSGFGIPPIALTFLSSAGEDEVSMYVARDFGTASTVMRQILGVSVVNYDKSMEFIKTERGSVVMDFRGVAIDDDVLALEEEISKLKSNFLCLYALEDVPDELVGRLTEIHDMTLVDASIPYRVSEHVEKLIRQRIDAVILWLLLSKSMCGKEIIECIHKNFGILVSAGTVYPALQILKEKGIITSRRGIRTHIYSIADEKRAREIVDSAREFAELLLKKPSFVKLKNGNKNVKLKNSSS